MRIYYFTSVRWGLQNIERRRLKVARIADLNDPFELMAPRWREADSRKTWRDLISQTNAESGLLCFSRNWHNPVQWSHYADHHKGICLGFDVPDNSVTPVTYSAKRLVPDLLRLVFHQEEEERFRRLVLTTKFSHWRYEKEVRKFVKLTECIREKDLYFRNFGTEFILKEVIVGVRSDLVRSQVVQVLGTLSDQVKLRKARLAFNTFSVVEQRDASLWT